jgi:uncharacterized phage protein gp47/JayE
MPFERPLLDALRARIADDLANKLPGADARLRVNNLRAFSEVEAGTTHLLYGRLEWSFRQLFPDTAEEEFLERWASIWGVQRYPATAATGLVAWAAQPGAQVPAGALMQRGGVRYHADAGGSEYDGQIVLFVQADEPSRAGNANPGAVLRLSTTAAGVAVEGIVEYPGLAGGADQQSLALLLQAVLMCIRQPPHGGAAFDYVRWALEVPGVTRAWCYPLQSGAGSVVVRFMMDDVRANNPAGAGIPTEADVVLVAAHIDPVRPVTARILVYPPIAYPVDVTIAGIEPDTPEIRDMIAEGLAQMLLQETEPGGSIYLSQWSAAIAFTPGVRRFVLVAPAAQVDVEVGEIVALGEVHYQ